MKYSVAAPGLSTRNAVVFLHKKEERTAAKYFPIPSLLPMKRELLLNSDGSHTVAVPGLQVTCHSVHGAVPESRHVFIKAALKDVLIKPSVNNTCIRTFETGFDSFNYTYKVKNMNEKKPVADNKLTSAQKKAKSALDTTIQHYLK